MRYVEPIFRPGPTEGNSYLLQVTMGCAHNKCTFCSFFKDKPFRTRPLDEIREDLRMTRAYYPYDPPVFLIDGDGFVVGRFPEDRSRVIEAISNRRVASRLLDQKLMVGGML